MADERLVKHGLAFILGMGIIGGLVYWSMTDSMEKFNDLKSPILTVHQTDLNCILNTAVTDKKECTTVTEVSGKGTYVNLEGEKKKLTVNQIVKLRTLIKETDFNDLTIGDSSACHTRFNLPEISFSFQNEKGKKTRVIPCTYSNANDLPLFQFIDKTLGFPSYYSGS